MTTSRPTSRSSRSSPLAPDRQHPPDLWHLLAHVDGARAGGRDDAIAPRRRAVALEPRQVVAVVVHRVVGDVDDVVAERRASRERGADPGDALGRAIDDAIEIDEEEHGAMLPSGHARNPAAAIRLAVPIGVADRIRLYAPIASSPLDGTTRLLVDGTNLLYRMGGRGLAPPAALIGRLRAAVPGTVTIDLVFDGVGHGVFGRVAQGMTVRYSGKRSADDVILDLASEAAMEAGQDRAPSTSSP